MSHAYTEASLDIVSEVERGADVIESHLPFPLENKAGFAPFASPSRGPSQSTGRRDGEV